MKEGDATKVKEYEIVEIEYMPDRPEKPYFICKFGYEPGNYCRALEYFADLMERCRDDACLNGYWVTKV